jgi:hypothetical protein
MVVLGGDPTPPSHGERGPELHRRRACLHNPLKPLPRQVVIARCSKACDRAEGVRARAVERHHPTRRGTLQLGHDITSGASRSWRTLRMGSRKANVSGQHAGPVKRDGRPRSPPLG